MAQSAFGEILRFIRKACALQGDCDQTDHELLDRFLTHREEDAFTYLVRRHGAMVFGVCRRLLGDSQEAEDAFQATFLVLIRRTSSIRRRESLGSWLHSVAQRIALRARAQSATRRNREREAGNMAVSRPIDDLTLQELRLALDEEISSLSEKYRAPIVLCLLEGKTHDQAARELGCPKTSLTRRLARGRELLRHKLGRRGITLAAGALATSLAKMAAAAPLPALLTIKTVKAATLVVAGKAVAGGCFSAGAVALAEEAVAGMVAIKGKVILMVLALGLAVGGAGWAGYMGMVHMDKSQPAPEVKEQAPAPKQQASVSAKKSVATDQYGDPLPEGAMARLGTVRFRQYGTIQLAFAPGGKVLASCPPASGVRFWDAASGRPLPWRLPETLATSYVAFSLDGNLVAAGGGNGIHLWSLTQDKELRQLSGQGWARFAFSPDGKMLAGQQSEPDGWSRIILWDVNSGKELRRLHRHTDEMNFVFSPDGKTLASASGEVHLWDVSTGRKLRQLAGTDADWYVAFAPDSKTLASSGKGPAIRLWDVETGKPLRQMKGDEFYNRIEFAPNRKLLASAGPAEGTIRLWDPETGNELRRWKTMHAHVVTCIAFSPDGNVLASGSQGDGMIRRWDTNTGKEIEPASGHTAIVGWLRFTPDGKTLFSSGNDRRVLEWDLASGRARHQLFDGPLGPADEAWHGYPGDLRHDGKVLALAGGAGLAQDWMPKWDSIVRLWDAAKGKELHALPGHAGRVWPMTFSPDGKLLASGGKDGIRFWNVVEGKELRHIPGQQAAGAPFAFSPDGQLLASVGDDHTICLWEVATGKELRRWHSTHLAGPVTLTFAPDGKSLASAGRDSQNQSSVRVWATATGNELLRFGGSDALSLTFSPSGRILAAAGMYMSKTSSAEICLWDVQSGQEIRRIRSPQESIHSLAFTPDAQTLASGGGESTILLWDLTGQVRDGKLLPAALTAKELEKLWVALGGDAAQADRVIWMLARAPQETLPLLKTRLQPVAPADAEKVAKQVADLDSPRFAERDKAAKALQEMGEAAEGAMRKVMDGNPSLEVRRRLERILDHDKQTKEKEVIRRLRAIETVEHIGTSAARQLLEALAKTSPNPRLTQAAAAALQRLTKQMPETP